MSRYPYRWNYHSRDNGQWCRWSHVNVTEKLASSEDTRCPWECRNSKIEPAPAEDESTP